jgi:hypothetical protein
MENSAKKLNAKIPQAGGQKAMKGSKTANVQVEQNPDCVQGTNDESVLSKRYVY